MLAANHLLRDKIPYFKRIESARDQPGVVDMSIECQSGRRQMPSLFLQREKPKSHNVDGVPLGTPGRRPRDVGACRSRPCVPFVDPAAILCTRNSLFSILGSGLQGIPLGRSLRGGGLGVGNYLQRQFPNGNPNFNDDITVYDHTHARLDRRPRRLSHIALHNEQKVHLLLLTTGSGRVCLLPCRPPAPCLHANMYAGQLLAHQGVL